MVVIVILAFMTPRIQNLVNKNKTTKANNEIANTITTTKTQDNVEDTGVTDNTGNTDNSGNTDSSGNTDNSGNTDDSGNTDNSGNTVDDSSTNSETEAPIVPNMVGITGAEAIKAAEDIGLVVAITSENSSTIQKDYVISQSVKEGTILKKGDSINIVVSLGKTGTNGTTVKMPNLVGMTREVAEQTLKTLGLNIKYVERYDDKVKLGLIVNQWVNIGAETTVGSTVTAVISLGKEDISEWSEWTTSLPQGITSDTYAIENVVKYQYRDKEIKTSSESTISGWIKYDSGFAWTEWSDWSTTPSEVVNNREYSQRNVEDKHNRIIYKYSRWAYVDNNNNISYSYTDLKGTDYKSGGEWQYTKNEDSALAKVGTLGNQTKYTGSWFNQEKTEEYSYSTYHPEYQHRDYVNTNYFYRWSIWSNWSDTVVKASDTREINTQKMYRYKLK
ncbi:MAG: non-specific serine/threonine protein kinase [Clostridiales bacterium]|nr:non-specific serine/threonine protein kinase [Clostridiales bacterium]